MLSVELKTKPKDWLLITFIGGIFGLTISLFFYSLFLDFRSLKTLFFGVFLGVIISLIASILITLSNNYILPRINKIFWYLASFLFSFLSGFIGFLFSIWIFSAIHINMQTRITQNSTKIALIVGFLTLLIGVILHRFISMKYRNEKAKNELEGEKLKALENELNPHFLFNALNSIVELIHKDPKKAEQSILDLSDFLRGAIKIQSIATLDSEIEMVKKYVEIENIRFKNQIKLHIENSAKNINVPKFSIQLLVENAIKHGYETKELNIYIKANNEQIEVANDGKMVEKLLFGTGLSNLNNRLNLLSLGKLEFENKNMTKFIIRR